MRRHSHTFTFSTFTNLLSRSSPHEAKLHLLRNIELFSARPDMLTRAVATVPWDTALALLDASFYVVKDIEPKTYSVALRKMAAAQAATEAQQAQRRGLAIDEMSSSASSTSSSSASMWRQAVRILSRLVAAEGDQTPPTAFVDAAQCLIPSRQWESALRYIVRPADDRGVASRALLMSAAESSATQGAWLVGLRAYSLALPLEWRQPHTQIDAAGDDDGGGGAESAARRAREIEQASRVAALLLSVAPWSVGMKLLLQEPADLSRAKKRRVNFPWQASEAVLTSERASMLFLEGWLERAGNAAVPVAALKAVAANSCLGPALVPALPRLLAARGSTTALPVAVVASASSTADSASSLSSPTAIRLALSLALRTRDFDSIASLTLSQQRSGGGGGGGGAIGPITRFLGRARCSAAVSLLGRSPQHDGYAALVAERCATEGTRPLEADAVRAAVSSLYHHHHRHPGQQQQQQRKNAATWQRAFHLVSRLRHDDGDAVAGRSRSLDAKSLTQLVHLCVFGGASHEALRLIGWAKQREGIKLKHESVLTALLFCAQHGRWQEAAAMFGHNFAAQEEQCDRAKDVERDAAAQALLPILWHTLRQEETPETKKVALKALSSVAPGFPGCC